jgi:hypothetical protein
MTNRDLRYAQSKRTGHRLKPVNLAQLAELFLRGGEPVLRLHIGSGSRRVRCCAAGKGVGIRYLGYNVEISDFPLL